MTHDIRRSPVPNVPREDSPAKVNANLLLFINRQLELIMRTVHEVLKLWNQQNFSAVPNQDIVPNKPCVVTDK